MTPSLKPLLLSILLASPVACHAEKPANRDFAIQLFMQGCVASYSRPDEVDEQAKRFGLTEALGEATHRVLAGRMGRVWQSKERPPEHEITLLSDGLCTVLIHHGDADQISAALESWLPPTNSGIGFVKEKITAPEGLESFRYTIRGGKIHEEWTLTMSRIDLPIPLRAMISYKGL